MSVKIILFVSEKEGDWKQKWLTLQRIITRALKCKPSAGDMIIKKPEE